MSRKEAVESQYAKVAAQHSSQWKESEIHDRLRQEIYRLAKRVPPPLDERGIPQNSPDDKANLVEIPSLGKGEMIEGGVGYRQYRINLRIPSAEVGAVVDFLERLQESPQSLRIDELELNRMPESDLIGTSIDITRTIVNGTGDLGGREEPGGEASSEKGDSAGMGRIPLSVSDWKSKGCKVELTESAGRKSCLEIKANDDNATAELFRKLSAGTAYEMFAEIACKGKAELAVGMKDNSVSFPETVDLKGDGEVYRYQIQFGVPDTQERISCPRFILSGKGTSVQVYNLLLRRLAE
jgi:hypothetical protein